MAPLDGVVAAACAILVQSVCYADWKVQSHGQRRVARPVPAAYARAFTSRLTRSSCRTWPHLRLRMKVLR